MSTARNPRIYLLGLLVVTAALLLNPTSFGASVPAAKDVAQKKDKKDKKSKRKAKDTGKAPTTIGKPMLWEDQGDVAALDLYWGIGGPDQVPKPPFTFTRRI